MTSRLLLIDDDPAIIRSLLPVLQAQGYDVAVAGNGAEAVALTRSGHFDVYLLDLGLPDVEGHDLIPRLVGLGDSPVLILSARHLESEKVKALDAGAVDYIDKPFGIEELLARIRAALRSRQKAGPEEFHSGPLRLRYATREVWLDGEDVKLSPKEYALLEVLCRNAGQVITARRLAVAGWGDPNIDRQYLRTYISFLRQKLEEDASYPVLLITEPGVGYRLTLR